MAPRSRKSSVFSIDDITMTHGVDAFIEPGKQRKTLAIDRGKRTIFFASRDQTKDFLLKFRSNPPIEEGEYVDVDHRDREGELIVTTSAIRLLLNELISKPHADLRSNADNLHVIDENINTIKDTISKWKNSSAVDAKIIYLNHGHMIHIYLRRVGNIYRCFILDSEPERPISNMIDAVHEVITDAVVTRSTTPLQMDFFSCPIFSTRAMKYFIKHGHEAFSYIDSHTPGWNENLKCFELQPENLMPELMKMIQSRMKLPDDMLDQIVSHKRNLTLRQYLDGYRVTFSGKTYNACAVIKRYQYLDKLDHILNDQISSPEGIRLGCLIRLIESYQNFTKLHESLMTRNNEGLRLLDYLSADIIQRHPEMTNTIVATIRKAYATYPTLLEDLTKTAREDILRHLIIRPEPRQWPGFFHHKSNANTRMHTAISKLFLHKLRLHK